MRNMITKVWCIPPGWRMDNIGYLGECDGSLGSGLFPIRGEWFRISPTASVVALPMYLSVPDMVAEGTETPVRGAP